MQVLPILLYHSIDAERAGPYGEWTVTPDRFERQLALLADRGFRPITLRQAFGRLDTTGDLPDLSVVISFDDGLRDFRTGALPVLDRFGFAATLFVVTGHVGGTATWLQSVGEGDRAMLNWSELADIAIHGIELGAHTRTHPQLDLIAPSRARDEIVGSKHDLEDALGGEITSFAYPHGYATPAIRRIVSKAGFACACRVRNALSGAGEDRFALSRIVITEDVDALRLASLLAGGTLPVAPPADRLVSVGWRLARRIGQLVGSTG